MAAVPYKVILTYLNGAIIDEVPVSNLTFGYALDEAGSCSFTVALKDPKCTRAILEPGEREVKVYRDGVLVWGGYLWTAYASWGEGHVRFACEGYLSRLSKRLVTSNLTYTSLEQFDIAWNLIAHTQAKTDGNLGITRGPEGNSGVQRTRKYAQFERPNILEEIQGLADAGTGFDFEIDQNKVFHMYYPEKGSNKLVNFELGKNIGGFSYDIDTVSIVNSVSAIGAGEGELTCVASAVDTASRSKYGLMEDTLSLQNIKRFDTLQDRANGWVARNKDARFQPQGNITGSDPVWTTLATGDRVTILGDYGYMELDQSFRIVTMLVQIDNTGNEQYQVTFEAIPA